MHLRVGDNVEVMAPPGLTPNINIVLPPVPSSIAVVFLNIMHPGIKIVARLLIKLNYDGNNFLKTQTEVLGKAGLWHTKQTLDQ